MSKQLELAQETWKENRGAVAKAIETDIDRYLAMETSAGFLLQDHALEPFRVNDRYRKYTEKYGNADDETCFIGDVWALIICRRTQLRLERRTDLLYLLEAFLKVNVEGL